MKTLKKVKVGFKLVEQLPDVSEMEEGIIYISDEYNTSGHKCLCGCGSLTIMPWDKSNWDFKIHNNELTVTPSVGNFCYPCKSHYIITEGVANFV